jgi:hypothetical protein
LCLGVGVIVTVGVRVGVSVEVGLGVVLGTGVLVKAMVADGIGVKVGSNENDGIAPQAEAASRGQKARKTRTRRRLMGSSFAVYL